MHDHRAHEAMMMTEAFLVDGCARCAELSAAPLGLDTHHIAALWPVMVRHFSGSWRLAPEGTRRPLSLAEEEACRQLYRIAVFLERFAGVDPWVWPIPPNPERVDWAGIDTARLVVLRGRLDREVEHRLMRQLARPTHLDKVDEADESGKVVDMDNHRKAAAGGEG